LSWIAGFWEGEGSLSIYDPRNKKARTPKVCLTISQSGERGKRVLEEISSKFGGIGHIYCSHGGFSRRKPSKWNPVYVLQVARLKDVLCFIQAILPYMQFRRDEVEPKLRILESLEVQPKIHWTNDEVEYLKNFHGKQTNPEIGRHLKRTTSGVVVKANSLGLTDDKRKFWEEEELNFLIQNYRKLSCKEIGKNLHRDYNSVRAKIHTLRKEGVLM
jgi:hypothetical protein